MTTPVHILDGSRGSSDKACVTSIGQLVVAPFDYDLVIHQELATINTAYNFYAPKTGKQFVVTGMYYNADQQVATNVGATVIIYEADTASETTVDKVIHQDDMIRNDRVTISGANILINEGKYVNAKTDDDDIHMTITGYYIPKIS